jgi:transposase
MCSYVSPAARMLNDLPMRTIRALVNGVLQEQSRQFDTRYSPTGRPSMAPEKWRRALLRQVLSTLRSERLLMEQLDDHLLCRWFVGLNMDDAIWDPTMFSKNRERLLAGEVAQAFVDHVLAQGSDARIAVVRPLHRGWDPDGGLGGAEARSAARGEVPIAAP